MSDWYYAENNEQKGPINESELKALFAASKVPTETLVWKDGMANWTPASQLPAFSFRPPPAPAAVQPMSSAVPAVSTSAGSTAPSEIMGLPETLEVDPDDAEKNKIFGILAYLSILFLVPLLAAKDSPYAKYHANQGLVLFLGELVIWIGVSVVEGISFFLLPAGFGAISLLFELVKLAPVAFVIFGIVNAAQSKCVPLPLIGGIKLLK